METGTRHFTQNHQSARKNRISLASIIFVIIAMLTTACANGQAAPASPTQEEQISLSQAEMRDQYGIEVNLVAVTAIGGLVDLRLKLVDSEKAKILLQQPENFPALFIQENGITLSAPDDVKSQEINFDDTSNLLILYPNTSSAVKPGTPVSIMFGAIQLEPIESK